MRFAEPVKFLFLPEMGLFGSQASVKTKSLVLLRVLPSRSAQFGLAWAGNKNQDKFHVQPCHFHCFL